jgi:hypothetical protein
MGVAINVDPRRTVVTVAIAKRAYTVPVKTHCPVIRYTYVATRLWSADGARKKSKKGKVSDENKVL